MYVYISYAKSADKKIINELKAFFSKRKFDVFLCDEFGNSDISITIKYAIILNCAYFVTIVDRIITFDDAFLAETQRAIMAKRKIIPLFSNDMMEKYKNDYHIIYQETDTCLGEVLYNLLPMCALVYDKFSEIMDDSFIEIIKRYISDNKPFVIENGDEIMVEQYMNCIKQEAIVIPKSIKKIGNRAFYQCVNLKEIEIEKDSNLIYIGKEAFAKTMFRKMIIPKTVKEIAEGAFSYCRFVIEVEFSPDIDLYKISDDLFSHSGLMTFTMPTSVKIIGKRAFLNSCFLERVNNLENTSLEIIEERAFENTYLKEISLPVSLKKIGEKAFDNCSQLEKINYAGSIERWKAINKSHISCQIVCCDGVIEEVA